MHILITGATGLIGSRLIHRWRNQHRLTVLTRDTEATTHKLGTDIVIVDSLSDINFNDIDAVINLAGEPIVGKRWSDKQKSQLCQSRWQLTEQISSAIKAAQTPPKVLISGSAIGYYGRQQHQRIDEDYPHPYPEFSHQLCEKWEALAQNAQSATTRVCIIRTGIVLANAGGALQKMLLPFKLGLGGRIGDGNQFMSWVHIDDMARLIDFLLLHPTLTGVFNATAPMPVTNAEFSKTLASVLQRPCLLPMPALALKLMLGEMADLLLTGQCVIPANLTKAGFEFTYTELEPALRSLLR